ncbi:hypothetical protein M2272_005842 [Mycobacterium frederiksbergense]|uniref:Uncharacterized protein n=1 Tax=Mycolicibacterium frederiksbergense TaxID=117567 RepID=A0ABT6L8E4_9MYCO|nr:hypothetical protein [Mycolicibacterium frederiksbergense]MDH6199174.1 hypothetical protein [Mycolicibacterium frederiksbergense]
MAAKKPPTVKQCTDRESHMFGAVAVQAADDRWGVMHPANGGHWATDNEVADWSDLAAP